MVTVISRSEFEVIMISKLSFRCNECGKEFVLKGHWYNQMLIEWWREVRKIIHCATNHPETINKKDVLHALRIIFVFIPLLVFQVLDIIAIPFKLL